MRTLVDDLVACDSCGDYDESELNATIIEVLEKQIPQKPIERWIGYEWAIKCPVCGKYFDVSEYEWARQFCGGCGQKIDWSDTE